MGAKLPDTNTYRSASSYPGVARFALKNRKGFLFHFVRWSWIVLLVFSTLQIALFGSLENAAAVACVVLAWLILTKFFLRPGVLQTYPLSSFLVLGFTTTQFYFPLVFTLLEGKPVIFNMDLPGEVFLHSVVALLVLVLSHLIYRSFSGPKQKQAPSLLVKAGFFRPPTDRQLWMMGFLGLGAMFYVYFYSPSVGHEVSGAGDKFIHGLVAFSYAPFFIPFGRLYGKRKLNSKRMVPLLVLFTILLIAISLGRNSRGAFMLGFTSLGFAYGLGLLLGVFKTRLFSARNIFIALAGLWFLTGPLADLATAMVIVRSQRNDIARSELVELTLEAYNNKEAIDFYRSAGVTQEREWDEQYMNNLFLARFSNLKYNDASLMEASKLNEQDQSMFQFTIDRFLSNLPKPALAFLGLDVDKEAVTSMSFGDFLHYNAGADANVLGGFRTGHFAGTGMAAFGWWYLLILGLGIMPVYYLYDKLFIRNKVAGPSAERPFFLEPRFSFCGLLTLTSIFMFLPTESVMAPFSFLFRGFIQLLLLYFLVYHFTRFLSILMPKVVIQKNRRRRRTPLYNSKDLATSKPF